MQTQVNTPPRLEPLLTVDDAATFLAVSRRQVYLLLDSGAIPAVRVGTRLRFVPGELRAYLERGRQEQAP
jgi:excisionase family DNA binding protein